MESINEWFLKFDFVGVIQGDRIQYLLVETLTHPKSLSTISFPYHNSIQTLATYHLFRMSQSASSTTFDDDNVIFKHDLTGDFEDKEGSSIQSDVVEVIDVASPSTKSKQKIIAFDEYYSRCFIVEFLEPPTDAKIKTETIGVFITKKVFNMETYDPLGTKRIVTAWEDHAVKLYRWFL